MVVSGAAATRAEVERYAGCTLLAAECDTEAAARSGQGDAVSAAVRFLTDSEFISLTTETADGTLVILA